MLVSKKNRITVYSYLFKGMLVSIHWLDVWLTLLVFAEGVMVAKKDYSLPKHDVIDVPNLQVIKLMQSFKSKNFVKETFSWQRFYWYLTNEGIDFLRGFLHLPDEIVPATLKKQAAIPTRPAAPGNFGRGRFDKEKSVGPSAEFNPEFVSGWFSVTFRSTLLKSRCYCSARQASRNIVNESTVEYCQGSSKDNLSSNKIACHRALFCFFVARKSSQFSAHVLSMLYAISTTSIRKLD